MINSVYLRSFTKQELILNDNETRIVLLFIFGSSEKQFIESMVISDAARGFAQGLLIEAIDSSYAIGFVEAIFRSTANPTQSAVRVFKSFGKKAIKHWFKHAQMQDLRDVQIYDFVRTEVARNFKTSLRLINGIALLDMKYHKLVSYNKPSNGNLLVWG